MNKVTRRDIIIVVAILIAAALSTAFMSWDGRCDFAAQVEDLPQIMSAVFDCDLEG